MIRKRNECLVYSNGKIRKEARERRGRFQPIRSPHTPVSMDDYNRLVEDANLAVGELMGKLRSARPWAGLGIGLALILGAALAGILSGWTR